MAAGNHVAYYRVSTARQGRSGLGLDAQRTAVRQFLDGGKWSLVGEFTEVESGRKDDDARPKLAEALRLCRLTGSRLVIAKLDRLSRRASFLLRLQDGAVPFVAADMPQANELTVGIMAVVAQDEAKRISERTRAALAEARRRGTRLGNPLGAAAFGRNGRAEALEARRRRARAFAWDVAPIIADVRAAGAASGNAVAAELNRRGIRTASNKEGKRWTATAVFRVRRTAEAT